METSITKMNMNKTSSFLRVLAYQLDNEIEETPDFFICVVSKDSELTSTHRAVNTPFELIGLVEYRKTLLIDEIER